MKTETKQTKKQKSDASRVPQTISPERCVTVMQKEATVLSKKNEGMDDRQPTISVNTEVVEMAIYMPTSLNHNLGILIQKSISNCATIA